MKKKVLNKNRERKLKEISAEMDRWKKRHLKETGQSLEGLAIVLKYLHFFLTQISYSFGREREKRPYFNSVNGLDNTAAFDP
jgi:hypothetical protein